LALKGVAPFRVWSRKNMTGDIVSVILALIPLRGEKNFSHTHKAGS